MWFCKKKEQLPDTNVIAMLERHANIERLEDKFKKGDMFKYLDVECIVTHTRELYMDFILYDYSSAWRPIPARPITAARAMLKADYVDKNGVIRVLSLSYEEAMRIET